MIEEKKHILFFSNFPPPQTGQAIVTQMNFHFLKDYFVLEAIDTSSQTFLVNKTVGGKIKRIKDIFKNYYKLYKKVKRNTPDHLYIVASSSTGGHIRDWITVFIARRYVDHITAHIHNGDFSHIFEGEWHQTGTQKFLEHIDSFLFLSETLAQRVVSNISEKQIEILPNTTEPNIRCSREEINLKIKEKQSRDKLIATFLSNMIPSKGYMDLLKAIPEFIALCEKDIEVNFVGNWANEGSLSSFEGTVDQLGVGNKVKIFGGISDRSKIKNILLVSDVFVLPTYYPLEAQPISIIEAMNAGTPIISTVHASIPDYVIDNVNGYLIDKKSPKQIAKALVKLNDYENWQEKALSARSTYEQKFKPEVIKKRLIEHFKGN